MIIYRKTPFTPSMKNIIILDAGMTDGYIYVSKETYEQAVAIAVTFSKDHDRIERALGKTIDGWKITPGIFTVCRKAREELPEPLNVLSTFISLAYDSGITWNPQSSAEEMCELVCGVLHTISQFADFYSMTLVPADQRTKLDIPNHVYKGYKESWDSLVSELDARTITVSSDEIGDVVKAAVDASIGSTVEDKVKESISNIKLPDTKPAEIDTDKIKTMIEKEVAEYVNTFIGAKLPMLISQQIASMSPMMNPMMNLMMNQYQQPYQQAPMMQAYQPQYQQAPSVQQVIQPQAPVSVAQPVSPVSTTPQTTQTTTPQTNSQVQTTTPKVEDKPVQTPNGVDLEALAAKMEAMKASAMHNAKEASKPAPPKEPVQQVLTESVRKEKTIAEQSQKIIQTYDI